MRDTANGQIRTIGAINILIGIWLIISPFVLGFTSSAARIDSIIFGIVVIIFGAVREAVPQLTWPSWVNFVVGVWLIISPFVLSASTAAAYWNLVIFGIIVAVLAFANSSMRGAPVTIDRTHHSHTG